MFLRGDSIPIFLEKFYGFKVFYENTIKIPKYFGGNFTRSPVPKAFTSSLKRRTILVLETSSFFRNAEELFYISLLRIPLTVVFIEYIGKNPEKMISSEKFFDFLPKTPFIIFYPKNLQEFLYMTLVSCKVSENARIPSVVLLERDLRKVYSDVPFPEDIQKFLGDYQEIFDFQGTLGCEIKEEDFRKIFSKLEKDIEESREEIRRSVMRFEMEVDRFGNLFLDIKGEGKEIFVTVGSSFYRVKNAICVKVLKPFPKESLRKILEGKNVKYLVKEGLKGYFENFI